MKRDGIALLVALALLAGCIASGAQAQGLGFTFGVPTSDESARPNTHQGSSDRHARKVRGQAVQCRQERHQVYDAHGQMQWRTIRVCG